MSYGGTSTNYGSSTSKKLQQTQAQVDEVVDVMRTNVDKVLERDQKLSELDDRADALQQGASQFETQAAKLKRKYWWKNCKMIIMLSMVVVIIVVVVIIYFTTKWESSVSVAIKGNWRYFNNNKKTPPTTQQQKSKQHSSIPPIYNIISPSTTPTHLQQHHST